MSTREILYQEIAVLTDEQIEELVEFVRKIKKAVVQKQRNQQEEFFTMSPTLI